MKKVMESHGIFVGKFCMNPARTESPGHNRPTKVGDYVRFLHQ